MTASVEAVPIRALLVDDDPLLLALLSAFLEERGYAVLHAADGLEALQVIQAEPSINLVVTDRHMPRMDGLALCAAIRALPAASYRYCVMLTSASDEASLVSAMHAGVDDFIGKPLRFPELGARLHAAERVIRLEASLAARNASLQDAYTQLSRELELARALQLAHLPRPVSFDDVRFDWVFEASSFVGGDTFDCFALDSRHLCTWIADVSGHGVAAAMIAFDAQHQLFAAAQQVGPGLLQSAGLGAACVGIAEEVNRRFQGRRDTSIYFTMVLALVDLNAHRLAFVQAGHPPPLYSAPGSTEWTPMGAGGLPVGILAEPGYEARELEFSSGARFALHSDGVTECADAQGTPFGDRRLQALLARHRHAPLADCGRALEDELRAWRGGRPLDDDMTWLALEVA